MSLSPPIRRLSTASSVSSRQEELINAYEAEEERIINLLSRKLEKLREEKIDLENALEQESEAHVNKLNRELRLLRLQSTNGTPAVMSSPLQPDYDTILEALKMENEHLRHRLVDTEKDFVRVTRLNEIYREELIEHRRRLGLSVDNLIGLSADPHSQPTHHRSSSSQSSFLSPAPNPPAATSRPKPIPRTSSQIHRPPENHFTFSPPTSMTDTTASSVDSMFLSRSPLPTSHASVSTAMTSPPSSGSINSLAPIHFTARPLTYPSVPPPSLATSPNVAYIPSEPSSRRNSTTARRGSFGGRRESVERGARVAESGSLIRAPRGRRSNQSLSVLSDEGLLLGGD